MNKIASIYDLLRKQYGVDIAIEQNPVTASLSTTNSIFLLNNPRRLAFVLINLGSGNIYVRPQFAASDSEGIFIPPSGGSLSVNLLEDLHLPSLEWHGIASVDDNAIFVMGVLIR